jgi:formyltetrahydrofolate deformylase
MTAHIVALLHGPDKPGLVARTAGWIFDEGGNILHADQHRDHEAGIFFQRIEWTPPETVPAEQMASRFQTFSAMLGMEARAAVSTDRPRVVLFVSRYDHCFHDVILRWKSGDLGGDLVGVISNHPDLEAATRSYGLPFEVVPVKAADKAAGEARQLEILADWRADVAVLARYMQVLSADMLRRFGKPVINIHHSFLPAFAGGRPYHQAHARGVKLIGATAHYATEELDEGPIIHQDVARVTHRHGVDDLVRKGRDLERIVLAQALRWHLEHRVLVYGRKTVVFD